MKNKPVTTPKYREEDLRDALDFIRENEIPVGSVKFSGTKRVAPKEFIDDPSHFQGRPAGWLNKVPKDKWSSELEQEYSRPFDHIIAQHAGQGLAPGIEIDGRMGDGRGRSIFSHAIGQPMSVAVFKSPVKKSEFKLEMTELAKMDPDLARHLKVMRRAAPESANALSRRLFTDTLIPEVGNRLAYDDFLSRPRKGGVYITTDGNSFGKLNKDFGQNCGDLALKASFGALSRASRQFRGKLWRVGGDEAKLYFEKPEHAYGFVREARKQLEALPPIKGQHHHSVSIGIGSNPDESEQALLHAKKAKKATGLPPGKELTHAHSLLPGAEGAVAPPELPTPS
jgi:GGDEF domain-containing protein